MNSGWVIQLVRVCGRCGGKSGIDPSCGKTVHEQPTEAEERAVMESAGIKPEERLSPCGWIAAIPDEWAMDTEGDNGLHTVTDPDGEQWEIEIPTT